jgi:hypothetical protein
MANQDRHTPATDLALIDYDSASSRHGIASLMPTIIPGLLGANSYEPRALPDPPVFPTATSLWRAGVVHYGIMIPDLPAPHHFLATMIVIGRAGFRAWDDDTTIKTTARDSVTLSHGTAATSHDPFSFYSARAECELAKDGSLLRFGEDLTVSGLYPTYRLQSRRPGFAVDIELAATGEIAWFIKSPVYDHLALFAQYRGTIEHDGQSSEVSGLCTYEYAAAITPHLLLRRAIPGRFKIPFDFFTYQIIDLGSGSRVLLVGTGVNRQAGWLSAYLRTEDGGVHRIGTQVHFQVLTTQPEAQFGNDAKPMTMPETFRWVVRDQDNTRLELTGTVDTHWLYAGMGHISGYSYTGRLDHEPIRGRGYLEYSDRRAP